MNVHTYLKSSGVIVEQTNHSLTGPRWRSSNITKIKKVRQQYYFASKVPKFRCWTTTSLQIWTPLEPPRTKHIIVVHIYIYTQWSMDKSTLYNLWFWWMWIQKGKTSKWMQWIFKKLSHLHFSFASLEPNLAQGRCNPHLTHTYIWDWLL